MFLVVLFVFSFLVTGYTYGYSMCTVHGAVQGLIPYLDKQVRWLQCYCLEYPAWNSLAFRPVRMKSMQELIVATEKKVSLPSMRTSRFLFVSQPEVSLHICPSVNAMQNHTDVFPHPVSNSERPFCGLSLYVQIRQWYNAHRYSALLCFAASSSSLPLSRRRSYVDLLLALEVGPLALNGLLLEILPPT